MGVESILDREIEIPLVDMQLNETEADLLVEKGGPGLYSLLVSVVAAVVAAFSLKKKLGG